MAEQKQGMPAAEGHDSAKAAPHTGHSPAPQKGVMQRFRENRRALIAIATIGLLVLAGAAYYWLSTQNVIYAENAQIVAPVIDIGIPVPAVIDSVYAKEGDYVGNSQPLVKVGGTTITSKVNGIITYVQNTPGGLASPSAPIIKMIDPRELRVVARVQEDKGLEYIKPGQRVEFTVDAFDNRRYEGVVESISPSARDSDVVFTISDKRQEQEFNVKVWFDVYAYPELKNGMSAKAWIYKN